MERYVAVEKKPAMNRAANRDMGLKIRTEPIAVAHIPRHEKIKMGRLPNLIDGTKSHHCHFSKNRLN